MDSEAAPPEPSKTKSQTKVRKRAPKACLSCRARKVRCDVSQRGRPCMNCYLDNESCVVTGRASRSRRDQQKDRDSAGKEQAAHPPCDPEDGEHIHLGDSRATINNEVPSGPLTDPSGVHQKSPLSLADDAASSIGKDRPKSPVSSENSSRRDHAGQTQTPKPTTTTGGTSFESFVFNSAMPFNGQLPPAPWSYGQGHSLGLDVTFSFYPFLALSNLHNIPPQDVNFLELQGCLRVPSRSILDEFVQQYFLHVHPLLPMLNEGDFWDMYCMHPASYVSDEKFSLLLFQAMLFASCNFISRQTIQTLGFPTIRAARAAFYRRAKLLYDLESESSPLAISQAALLLSYWSPPSSPSLHKSNTAWLAIAIQNAKTAEAHRYATRSAPLKKCRLLKRLWWSCIIRDRIVGLGMRRATQITRSHFDFDANGTLGYSDLLDEIERSRVYNPGTKRCLAEILEQLVELCVLLTDILILVFPLDDSPGWGREMRAEEQDKVRVCKLALSRWYKGATLRFPMFGGGSAARVKSPGNEFQHDSVILYTNLMYMYYHSARVVLSHHEVLHLAITAAAPSFSAIPTSDLVIIGENRQELQDAASGVTECLKELIQLRLARWLPISAVACTALPLVLHILDVRLSTSSRSFDPNTHSALKQHRLNILIEAMKTYQPQYDGVDWISETIRHIINLAQLDHPLAGESGNANEGSAVVADWTDILASQPSAYLRLALTMDLSLSKGRLPEDGDFPVSLRGLFTGSFNPVKMLLERKRDEMRGGSRFSAPTATFEPAEMYNSPFRAKPRAVTVVASDEDSNSSASASNYSHDSATDETSPVSGGAEFQAKDGGGSRRSRSGGGSGGGGDVSMADRPPSEGIDGLAAEVLAAFPLDDLSAAGAGADGDFDGMYFDGMPGRDGPNGWIENAWNEITQGGDRSDRDAAGSLLEALRDGGMAECAA